MQCNGMVWYGIVWYGMYVCMYTIVYTYNWHVLGFDSHKQMGCHLDSWGYMGSNWWFSHKVWGDENPCVVCQLFVCFSLTFPTKIFVVILTNQPKDSPSKWCRPYISFGIGLILTAILGHEKRGTTISHVVYS